MDDNNKSDHDLLVEIHTTLTQKIGPSVGNHERRIRLLEKYFWLAVGGIGVLEVIVHAAVR